MEAITKLEEILLRVSNDLHMVSAEEWGSKPNPSKWSKKEILGHLIDSEFNNHVRIIKSLAGANPLVIESYNQEEWVKRNHYQNQAVEVIYANWKNHQLAFINLVKHITADELKNPCILSDGRTESLEWLIDDYVRHQAHHLNQIFGNY